MKPVTELGKPSIMAGSTLFAEVSILIVDSDHRLAMLAKKVLFALGCKNIFLVHDGIEALELMKEEQIDLVITEWELKTMGGLELAQHLRQSLDSPNRMVPIVMLTARTEREDVRQARDIGITEYVIKPFSAKSLLERIYEVVENPRSFVLCKNYVGPDRRRKSSMSLPPDADEQRVFIERIPPIIVPKEDLKQLIFDDTPRIIMPDYNLKRKIGFEVPAEIITNIETLRQSQDAIDFEHERFMQWIAGDVKSMEEAYRLLLTSPDNALHFVRQIDEAASAIQSRAGTFGYSRASEVAGLLHDFCREHYDKENKYHLVILEKHIQTLSAIFTGKIKGDGGMVGEALAKDLASLIQKYLNKKA